MPTVVADDGPRVLPRTFTLSRSLIATSSRWGLGSSLARLARNDNRFSRGVIPLQRAAGSAEGSVCSLQATVLKG